MDERRVGETSMFEDWHAIHTLLMTFADHIDAGRYAEGAAMFEHATYRIERAGQPDFASHQGTAQVQQFTEATILYPDGTPRTKHVVTNVNIQIDGDRATSRSNATVFQQTDELPLQPIAVGTYIDKFERVDGEWRFADRVMTGFLLGDRSHHVAWHDAAPGGGAT